jgi:Flp pilus assembly protein TadD
VQDRLQVSIAATVARAALVAAFLWVVLPDPVSERVVRWRTEAETAAAQGDVDAAQRSWGRVLQAASAQDVGARARGYEALVDLSLAARRYDAARVYLYALAEIDGWTPVRRAQLRTIFDRSGEPARATALLMAELEAQHADPADPDVLREVALQAIEGRDWTQAEATLALLVTLVPDDAWAYYQLGLIVAPENPEYADEYFRRAALNPAYAARAESVRATLGAYATQSEAAAHSGLGVTLAGLGEWPFAERVLQMALEANAVNPTALAYLGFVRDQQGRDGLRDLAAARAMAPNEPVVYYMLGMHWRLIDQPQPAYAAFERAYSLDPDNPALAAEVGVSWQQLSELTLAEEWFRRAVELAPDDLRWQVLLAAFYADTGYQLDLIGLPYIQEVAERAPYDAGVQASLGWAHAQTGDVTRAYDELSAALGQDPANPRIRYYFGAVLEQSGDVQGAADSYWVAVDEAGTERGFGLLAARALQRLGYIAP